MEIILLYHNFTLVDVNTAVDRFALQKAHRWLHCVTSLNLFYDRFRYHFRQYSAIIATQRDGCSGVMSS